MARALADRSAGQRSSTTTVDYVHDNGLKDKHFPDLADENRFLMEWSGKHRRSTCAHAQPDTASWNGITIPQTCDQTVILEKCGGDAIIAEQGPSATAGQGDPGNVG